MDAARTFIAIAVPDLLATKLVRLQSLLAPDIPGMRWATALPFHITLAFVGDVAHAQLNEVCRGVAKAAAESPRFSLRIEGFSLFGSPTRPRTLWVGASGPGLEPLTRLHASIGEKLAEFGFSSEDGPFEPHITLARAERGRHASPTGDLTPQLNHYRRWAAGSFDVTEVITFSSTLTREGPVYAKMAHAPLSRKKAGKDA